MTEFKCLKAVCFFLEVYNGGVCSMISLRKSEEDVMIEGILMQI